MSNYWKSREEINVEEIRLISPSMQYDDEIMQFRKEIMEANDKDSFAGCGSLKSCSTRFEKEVCVDGE